MTIDQHVNEVEQIPAATGCRANSGSRHTGHGCHCNEALAEVKTLQDQGVQDDAWEQRMKQLNPHWHPHRYTTAEIS